MLEWTGERFLPWLREATIAYEHLHRYAYAAAFAKGKRVLDLASSEGYGSKILAGTASSVVGVDIDENTVRHAAEKYSSQNVQFIPGSITAVPISEDHSFDVIVCFEAIEHIEDQERLLNEVTRLLKPEGLFIVSTPNKAEYHHEGEENNPFHVKELDFDQFQQLLAFRFKNLRFLGQRILPGSSIWPIGVTNGAAFEEFAMERGETEFRFVDNEKRIPVYFIALASNSTVPVPHFGSVLLDHSNSLIQEKNEDIHWREQQIEDRKEEIKSLESALQWREGRIKDLDEKISALEEALKWREQHLTEREAELSSLRETLEWLEGQGQELTQGLDWTRHHISDLEKTVASQEEALKWRAGQVEGLERDKTRVSSELRSTEQQLSSMEQRLNVATEQLEAIYSSTGWKLILRLRHIRDRLKRLVKLQ